MKPPTIVQHGRYEIKAGELKTGTRGVAFLKDKKVLEASGDDIESVVQDIKRSLDAVDAANNEGRREPHVGTVKDYTDAFVALDIPASYAAMLRAHANAPDRILTLQQLADAANYESYDGAILHYGTLARSVVEFCGLTPRQDDRSSIPVYTCSLADFVHSDGREITDNAHHPDWAWRMHEEVAEALRSLKIA